jgi:hypothetical protein
LRLGWTVTLETVECKSQIELDSRTLLEVQRVCGQTGLDSRTELDSQTGRGMQIRPPNSNNPNNSYNPNNFNFLNNPNNPLALLTNSYP